MDDTINSIENLLQKGFYYLSGFKSTNIKINNSNSRYGSLTYNRKHKNKSIYFSGSSYHIRFFEFFGVNNKNCLINRYHCFDLDKILTHKHVNKELCLELFNILKEYYSVLHEKESLAVDIDYNVDHHRSDDLKKCELIIYRENEVIGSINIGDYIGDKQERNSQGLILTKYEKDIIDKFIKASDQIHLQLVDIETRLRKFVQLDELFEAI